MKVYRCDRCHKDLTVRYVLSTQLARDTTVTQWDICRECHELIISGNDLNDDNATKTDVAALETH